VRGKAAPAATLREYLLYVLLFPKLLAGPIVKYHDFAPQLRARRITADDLTEGFTRFLYGLAKKVLIADTMGEIVEQVFGLPPAQLGFANAWLGLACFTLQIYFDFSAYSDMAIGLARMCGFRLMENFNLPYVARSFTDFWQRWHISLSTWIREYLYLPLGGNRHGMARTIANLWLCFLLSGLWHGAQWTFVLWGAYHGLVLTAEKLFWLKAGARLPALLRTALTLLLVMLGWVIFRSASLEQMAAYFGALCHPARAGKIIYVTADIWLALCAGTVFALVPGLPVLARWRDAWRDRFAWRVTAVWCAACFGLFAIGKAVTVTFQPFLYFRF
jgi:alginate O-acetyltransferase complex protein AlgI